MKIGVILSPYCFYANVFNGVVVQARCWMEGLRALGHDVVLLQAVERIDWKSIDIVHLYQHGPWCGPILQDLAKTGVRVFLSPIIDPPRPYGLLPRLMSKIPFERGRLWQNQRLLRQYAALGTQFLARSELEAQSLRAVGVPNSSIHQVLISMSNDWPINDAIVQTSTRNGGIFHVSHLDQPRKNVRRLIASAIRIGASLRLAGSISDPEFSAWLDDIQARHGTIRYLGRISDEQMQAEMLSASVFCLPSLFEGVGLVALDAGFCGCNLVVSNCGGTRDYLGDQARYIDPEDDARLDAALRAALAIPAPNMETRAHIVAQFSILASARNLVSVYERVLG